MGRYMKKMRHMTLRQKILLLFVVTWIVSVAAVSGVAVVSQLRSSRSKETQEDVANLSICKQAMQLQLERVNLTGIRFSQKDSVNTLLSAEYASLTEAEQKSVLVDLGQLLYENSYVAIFGTDTSVAFFCNDGRVYTNTGMLLQTYDADAMDFSLQNPEVPAQQDGFSMGFNDIFCSERFQGRLQYRRSFRLNRSDDEYATLAFLLPHNLVEKAFSKATTQKDWMVVDQNGMIAAHSDKDLVGLDFGETYQVDFSQLLYTNGSLDGQFQNQPQILSYCADREYGLYYVYTMPTAQIYKSCRNILASVFIVACLALMLLIYLSWYLSRRFTAPLDKLGKVMLRAEKGDMDARMNPQYDDEIGVIGRRFDKMISQLKQSMENIQRVEQENRKAELKVMELQLNPHFLYNTLSSIIWLANEDQCEDVINITKSLALFYRKALSDSLEEVPVSDEVELVENYVNILRYRYQDSLSVEYDVAPGLGDYRILKLLLQPLVENSIHHGTQRLEDLVGIIRIKGFLDGERLVFQIWDNGAALDDTAAAALNDALDQGRSGIGTSNVHGRIKSHYGPEYGLRYSCQDGWTIATVELPAGKE